jgi:hypothetical protein
MATARVQPADAALILQGKHATVNPWLGSTSRLCSFCPLGDLLADLPQKRQMWINYVGSIPARPAIKLTIATA